MKNTIPLIIAIILAAATIFAVHKWISKPNDDQSARQYVEVVAASKPIPAGTSISVSMLMKRVAEAKSVPKNAIPWELRASAEGIRPTHPIAEGDYVVSEDLVGWRMTLPEKISEGEWAVPVTFADSSLVQFLQPGVEIAILGTYTQTRKIHKVDASEKADEVKEEATSVIFPCVRILDIGRGDGIRREDGGTGTIIVSLKPQQAATLVAAQRTMELYPALRRTGDTGSLKRRDVGMVTEATFGTLRAGLEPVSLKEDEKSGKK